ncbi:MAG TPA: YggS family pyridoxal phosphate-dependent enzyme [Anaerolineales bacterium]|nr:YggS family pyridoxal phosphate-dependent enzyme [Anaerolineales bacterium]
MDDSGSGGIAARYWEILDRIGSAAERSGRDPEAVRLVVVTKGHPVETIRRAIDAGVVRFGENYAEEAVPKIETLAGAELEWVMIGHVQSRKSGMVASHFDELQSLDSVKLARRLDEARPKGRPLPVLVQVNVSGEAAKYGLPGWAPDQGRETAPVIAAFIEGIARYSNLRLKGLMTVPPFLPPEDVRPFFRRLADLRDHLQDRFPDLEFDELSMGMSADFEAAIEEGATVVRIGTAILGPR